MKIDMEGYNKSTMPVNAEKYLWPVWDSNSPTMAALPKIDAQCFK